MVWQWEWTELGWMSDVATELARLARQTQRVKVAVEECPEDGVWSAHPLPARKAERGATKRVRHWLHPRVKRTG